MKRNFIIGLMLIFSGLFFSSCEQCMTCEINYTKSNGTRVTENSPQKCGYSWQLDDKKDELKEAYSAYDSVQLNCNREF